ncbi:MAG: class I SAM-dependent methyltransferase [Xanthobacteraceae bacterium]
MSEGDLRRLETHFAFGDNWRSFVATVNEEQIAEAVRGLSRLVPAEEMTGRRLIDIGCGSGLSMLAALRLGARSVLGIDIDPRSVEAARALLARHQPAGDWDVRAASVFDLTADADGRFDIVHSWGVLHHTGDLWGAIGRAAKLVAPGGRLVIAIYRKTPLCGFWQREKRFYSQSGPLTQHAIRLAYQAAYCAGLLATGRNPLRYIRDYKSARGMSWPHDTHDWLGGYPYESATPETIVRCLNELGFDARQTFAKPAAARGLFGSHCDEFVFARRPD